MKIRQAFLTFLFLSTVLPAYSQNTTFDSLANEINRISVYKKTKSLEILDTMYLIAYNNPDSSVMIAHCLYEESLLNFRQGIFDTTLITRIEKRLNVEHLPLQEQALLESALGTTLVMNGEYSNAFAFHLKTLEKFKQLKYHRFTARTLNYLGNICTYINLHSLAEYYFFEAIKYVTPEYHEYFLIKGNIFAHDLRVNKNETALDSLNFLFAFAAKNGNEEILPMISCALGGYFIDTSPEQTFYYLTQMETLDYDSPKLMAYSYNLWGLYFLSKNDVIQELYYYKKALKLMEEIKDFKNLTVVYDNLSTLFEEQNMPDSALFYARKYEELIQKLHSNTIAIETHQKYINTLLDAQQKDLIITQQQVELKNRQFVIIVIVSGSAILLVLMFLMLVQRQKQLKVIENRELSLKVEHEKEVQKLEKEKLDAKIREISSYSMLVSHKNHLLNEINELSAQMTDDKDSIDTTMDKIHHIIHGNLNIDEEWDNFKLHFDMVHPHFFEKLTLLSNDLTEENLKICAYYKMGITTKQIAQLLNVVPDSIIKNRYRIKKKLKLSDTMSLSEFIRKM